MLLFIENKTSPPFGSMAHKWIEIGVDFLSHNLQDFGAFY